jgi:hypothetical protein
MAIPSAGTRNIPTPMLMSEIELIIRLATVDPATTDSR